jgi:hypothetical protein
MKESKAMTKCCGTLSRVDWQTDVRQYNLRSSKIWVFCNIATKTSDLTQGFWQNRRVSKPRYECRSFRKGSRCSVESSCRMWNAVEDMAGDKECNVTITEWKASNCFEISPHSALNGTSRLKAAKRFNVDQLSWFRLNSARAYGEKIEATIVKSSLNTVVTDQAASDPVVWGKGAEQLYTLSHVFVLYILKNHNHNHTHILCPCILQFDFITIINFH